MLKRTKKGFTLAELLIVVAIIAVLTAIAVPIFVSSLRNAQKAVFQSNRDVVRTAAIVKILGDDTYTMPDADNKVIVATGTFEKDDNGSWTLTGVEVEAPAASASKNETEFKDWNVSDTTRETIIVHLTATDLSTKAAPGVGG